MPMPSFADFFGRAQYDALLNHDETLPRDQKGDAIYSGPEYKAWSATYKQLSEAAEAAIAKYLAAVGASQPLACIPDADMFRRTHRLAHAWNALAAGSIDDHQMARLARSFDYALLVTGRSLSRAKSRDEAYSMLVERVDSGTLEWFENDSHEECGSTGERVYFELHSWRPRLGTVDHQRRNSEFTALKPIPRPAVLHHRIPVPSGELLIADWFRIPAFTEAVEDPAAKSYEYSINNAAGRARSVTWHAGHGFMSVCVGNTSPSIVVRGGQLVIAYVDEEMEGPPLEGDIVGNVCTDYWWASVIDRRILTDIVARSMQRDEAERLVDDMVQNQASDVTTVKVKPGMLHFYFTPKTEDMQDFHADGVSVTSIGDLYAVASVTELSWKPRPATPVDSSPVDTATRVRKARP